MYCEIVIVVIISIISTKISFSITSNTYILFDGLTYNMRGYFASSIVFFRGPQGLGKIQAMSKNVCKYYVLNHRIRDLLLHYKKVLF